MRLLFLLLFSLNVQALQLLQPKDGHNTVAQKLGNEQTLSAKKLLTQLERGAKRGNVRAQFSLANMYHHGITTKKNLKLASYWYLQVAESGYPSAQFYLAEFYYNGIGMEKNLNQAIFWYEKAAQQDSIKAQYKLARIYHHGEDEESARKWYERAAKLGFLPAQLFLAQLYDKGVGIDKDLKLAQYWYEKAALQSNAEAQYSLADFFERTARPTQALLMYQKSAEQGFEKAQSHLLKNQKSIVSLEEISKSLLENSKKLKQPKTKY
ncbi:hypothetical protein MNB_SUP05-SYMBIONT-4-878 [hydrothermal vent metagenome]|uniref:TETRATRICOPEPTIDE REPEAT FAMILY PROTEIN n=1 Tax=hydrothermal vent metagenome TaxID=652676 RepID=A0A1W1DUV7_9ZZZZ